MKTVRDVIAELSKFPLDDFVLVGTAYDNDTALTSDVRINREAVYQTDGAIWDWDDPANNSGHSAVVIA